MAKNYTQLKQKESASSPGLFKESKPYSLVLYCINNIQVHSLWMHLPVTKTWAYTSLFGVLGGLINGGAYMQRGLNTTCDWTRKSASKQASSTVQNMFYFFWYFIRLQNVKINRIHFQYKPEGHFYPGAL